MLASKLLLPVPLPRAVARPPNLLNAQATTFAGQEGFPRRPGGGTKAQNISRGAAVAAHTVMAQQAKVEAHKIARNGGFPNSSTQGLPLLIYRAAFPPSAHSSSGGQLAEAMEGAFESNGFPPQWRYGMYPTDHFHSNTHEVLGVYKGSARLRFGGPPPKDGEAGGEGGGRDAAEAAPLEEEVAEGDVIVVPAGVAHRSLEMRDHFSMVGAYPAGCNWDMCYGEPKDWAAVVSQIAAVRRPAADPVYGSGGPLLEHWGQ